MRWVWPYSGLPSQGGRFALVSRGRAGLCDAFTRWPWVCPQCPCACTAATSYAEGALRNESGQSDLLLATRPGLGPSLFHWESQSTTTAASPTGQRTTHHETRGSRVLLFVHVAAGFCEAAYRREGAAPGVSPSRFDFWGLLGTRAMRGSGRWRFGGGWRGPFRRGGCSGRGWGHSEGEVMPQVQGGVSNRGSQVGGHRSVVIACSVPSGGEEAQGRVEVIFFGRGTTCYAACCLWFGVYLGLTYIHDQRLATSRNQRQISRRIQRRFAGNPPAAKASFFSQDGR